MKSEKPRIIEILDKLPKVITSCETDWQLVYAQRWVHLAYRKYPSRVLRILGDQMLADKRDKLNAKIINAPVVERHTR